MLLLDVFINQENLFVIQTIINYFSDEIKNVIFRNEFYKVYETSIKIKK